MGVLTLAGGRRRRARAGPMLDASLAAMAEIGGDHRGIRLHRGGGPSAMTSPWSSTVTRSDSHDHFDMMLHQDHGQASFG